jgi:hypothetical protein
MGSFIAQQPNGLYCRFSTIVDTVTHYNMTKDDYIEVCKDRLGKKRGEEEANDHYFVEPKGRFFFWGIEYQNSTIILGNFRKATVDELIEYFKTKEEQ